MKKIINILSIAAALTLTVPAFAKDTVKNEAAPAEAKPAEKKSEAKKDHYPLYGEVVAITDTLLTIKGGKDKPDRMFDITKDTKITMDDKPATVKDAKIGQWVGGYIHKAAEGDKSNDDLVHLNLSAKQKEEKKMEEKKSAPVETKKNK
jgi:hypothetical protein